MRVRLLLPASLVFASAGALSLSAYASGSPPSAAAGQDLYALSGRSVILDGTASQDPEGDPLSYVWRQVDGPPVDLLDPTTANPWFEGSEAGGYVFGLVVNDGLSSSGEDTVEIHLFPDADHDFYLEDGCTGCGDTGLGDEEATALALLLLGWRRRRALR